MPNNRKQGRRNSWILLLAAIGAVVLIAVVLFAAGKLQPVLSLSLPHTQEQAELQAVEIAITITHSPTPVPTATPRPTALSYPANAVTLVVNGSPMMALSNRDSAERMLSEYLSICANENLGDNERLIRAYIDASLAIAPVDGSVEYLPYEEAKTRLLANRSLLPVVRTTELVTLETGTVETMTLEQPALPVGTRFYRSLGLAEHRLALREIIYKSGIAVSDAQTLVSTRVGSEPGMRIEENGMATLPDAFAVEAVYPIGKDAGELQFIAPCRGGTLEAGFGMRDGQMHYGVDYALRAGAAILAPESGTVVFCGERGDYGLVIEILHGNGFVSRLTHCASPSVVLDQHVYRGEQIALLALEENEPSPHLHYELLIDSIPYNPLQYLPQ